MWHELITEEFRGWAYGYYLTEIWSPEEVEEEWGVGDGSRQLRQRAGAG